MHHMTKRKAPSEAVNPAKERVIWGAAGGVLGLALLLASGAAYALSNSDSSRVTAVLISTLSAFAAVWVCSKARAAALLASIVLAAAVIYGVATEVAPSRPEFDLSTFIYGATRGVLTPGLLGVSLGALLLLSLPKPHASSKTNGGKP